MASGPRRAEDDSPDPLRRLEQQLDRASEAAERLIAEAAQAAIRRPPPAGWQPPDTSGEGEPSPPAIDVDPLLEVLRGLRDRLPPELAQRLAEALRELLVALRALIDWYLERTDREERKPAEVQDIPIL